MFFRQLRLGPMANFVYLFGEGDEAVAVDPAFDVAAIRREAAALGARIVAILVTHGHPDHIEGVEALRAQTGAKVWAHERADHPVDERLVHGQDILLAGCRVAVVHTPGHRFDCACYVVSGTHLLTGDTLFVGDCGRGDLPGSDIRAMHVSLLETLAGLPGDLIVCPGHDYGPTPTSTLSRERATNPTLQPRTLDAFARFMSEP